ncbi:Utp14-domain-containing protein [Serendipita vermifera]|nr:Utp14-domain-containing protein [Serendipita vermifera]
MPKHTEKPTNLKHKLGVQRKKDVLLSGKKKKANIAGFEKRMARKPQMKNSTGMDVYEYNEKEGRKGKSRANITLDLSKEEAREYGVWDDEENEPDDLEKMRLKLKMGDEENVIDSDDDEDIDSDAAFGESDEERFANYNLKSKGKSRSQPAKQKQVQFDVDLNEDEDEEDGDEDEESDIEKEDEEEKLEDDSRDISTTMKVGRKFDGSDGSEDESDDSTEEENEEEEAATKVSDNDLSVDEDDEENEDALEALKGYIQNLEDSRTSGTKRKASDSEQATEAPPTKQRRRLLKERTQPGEEGEFMASRGTSTKLQLSDLIAPLASEGASSSAIALTSAMKTLNSTKAAPLSAPLPLRVQDRLDRQAAYEQTKSEVQKWEPTMKRIREADHLSFPLQSQRPVESNIAQLTSNFKPATQLESAVDRLLKAAELRDQDIAKTEELQMQHLSVEEIAERQAELRKMRDLMFRAEIKAKRVAKIKSKTYRKIQKKEKAKQAEKLKSLGLDVDEEAEQMKAELDRARERATLKHKATGKWAKSMRERGEMEEDQRKEMQEMYDRGERLKRKIAGVDTDEESDEEMDDDDDDPEMIASHAVQALDTLSMDDPDAASSNRKSTLMGMKFMREAASRGEAQVRGAVDSFKAELEKLGMTEEDETPSQSNPFSATVVRQGGRVSFNPGNAVVTSTTTDTEGLFDDRRADVLGATRENPWLTVAPGSTKVSRAKNEVVVGKNSNAASLSKNALKKRMRKTAEATAMEKGDAVLEIDPDITMLSPETKKSLQPGRKSFGQPQAKQTDTHDVDAALIGDEVTDDEREAQEAALNRRNGRFTVFEQRELVAQAFAGDNVVEEFAAEKRREMEADAPKEVDTTLPGWGSWGGAGITKAHPKPERIKRFPGIDPKRRQDSGKDHVIISEKKDKKAEKYLVKDLPFPYTSKAQFERRLEVPLGMEWNTRVSFQKATLPRVVKKMGTIIEPLEKLF